MRIALCQRPVVSTTSSDTATSAIEKSCDVTATCEIYSDLHLQAHECVQQHMEGHGSPCFDRHTTLQQNACTTGHDAIMLVLEPLLVRRSCRDRPRTGMAQTTAGAPAPPTECSASGEPSRRQALGATLCPRTDGRVARCVPISESHGAFVVRC